MTDYRNYLKREFSVRQKRNPSYSLRAYARDIGMQPSKLSEAMRGVCGLSGNSALKIARKLDLSEKETELFVALVEKEHARSRNGRNNATVLLNKMITNGEYSELNLERFSIISDWCHFAILELTEVNDFLFTPKAIAKRLQISIAEAKNATDRLVDFGLLAQNEKGQWKQTHLHLATPGGIPNRAVREHHRQILQKAEESIDSVALTEREFSATTMAIATEKLAEAKNALKEFRRKFCTNIQKTETKDRVYCLSIQLFPVDRRGP